ncbi:MAG TPA: DUF4861 family protein [Flavobacterium sp.]
MKNKLQFLLPVTLTAILSTSFAVAQNKTISKITLTNNSNLKLSEKAVSVNRNDLGKIEEGTIFPILLHNNDTIPAQLNDLNGDGKWDELFLVTSFSPKEKKDIQLKWSKIDPKYTIRKSVRFGKREAKDLPVQPATEEIMMADQVHKKLRFQKYQTDGPTWENDKVGFRDYLDGRNSKDVFGKKTPGITPENVGISTTGAVEDNYHQMYDWGRDIFPVGNSAGLGGYALLVNNEVQRLGIIASDTLNNVEKTSFKIVSEGPVNSVLNYKFQNWKTAGNTYQVNETTSIWPGMYAYKNTVSIDGLKGKETLLIALSNINNEKGLKVIESGDWVCLIQHDNLTYKREWILGTAILVPKKLYTGYMEAPKKGQLTDTYLAKLKVKNNTDISYYGVAGWELSADKNFKDAAYFTDYVTNLTKELSVKICVKTK